MNNVSELHKPINFTIDGRNFETKVHKQPAADLLRLAGLDPSRFDLGELKGQRPNPVRYIDDTACFTRSPGSAPSSEHSPSCP